MKKLIFSGLISFFFLACQSQPPDSKPGDIAAIPKEVVCFVYHRFNDGRYPTTNVSVKAFEAHLNYLIKNKFDILTFSQAVKYLKSNEPARKVAVITVDDGYKSFYQNGLPVLKKHSLPATLFINTETVEGGDYMSWRELQLAVDAGVEIGNHTHSHDYFLNQSPATRYQVFKEEIELSQKIIFEKLQIRPTVFSFPYGEFDNKMKSIVKEAGFLAAAAQNSGVMHAEIDFFLCPRFPISEAYADLKEFAEKASMHALRVVHQSPDDVLLPPGKSPALTITFDNDNLQIDRLQCFVQGGQCTLREANTTGNKTTITVQPVSTIKNRRRTLYTITVPDEQGGWHWFSRLWIAPDIKE